ncbi:MAG: endolytic transglycosylase MltG [Ignavibacteria bacterium]|nr:endolytic transglycosylase MltG [Ignavibacteria bacterium]
MKTAKNNFDRIISLLKVYFSKTVNFLKNAFDKLYPLVKEFVLKSSQYLRTAVLSAWSFSKEVFKKSVKELEEFEFTLDNVFRIIFISFIVLNIFALYFSFRIFHDEIMPPEERRIRISPGMAFDDIAERLESEGVIRNAFYFKLAAISAGKDDELISRTYIFKNPLNNLQLLDILTDPSLSFAVKLTIPEGMRMSQIAVLAETRLNLSRTVFMKEAGNDSLINSLNLKGKVKNLEGFLYPDTYKIPADITERELVALLFSEFVRKILGRFAELKGDSKKLLETVTLASIVQGETQIKEEMPVISGVYLNRIKKRMKLEADPTVQYALPDGPKKRLMRSDLKIKSPYNTYLNYGLPPGPINNPGFDAIQAALNPGSSEYIFFVATGKGGHAFSKTYKEHLKKVEQYRRNIETK